MNSAQSLRGSNETQTLTHCGPGAPQSMQALFPGCFCTSCNLARVSGSTSHSFDMFAAVVNLFSQHSLRSSYPLER